MISYPALIAVALTALVIVFLLVRSMYRLPLRAQFMVLLGIGVSISFILLVMVQAPHFPEGLGVGLVVCVFIASLFGTRTFLRSLAEDERQEEEAARRELPAFGTESELQNPPSVGHN
jgi:FlaA1/EpsC-like NDP-sugar epimerase